MLISDPFSRRQPRLLYHTRAFIGGGGDAPAPRNLTRELEQTLQGYQNTAGGFFDLNQQYQPLYAQLGLDTMSTQMGGYTDSAGVYHPGTVGLGQAANTSNRLSNTADLGLIGPGVTNAILGSNPGLGNSLQTLNDFAQPSGILQTLNRQAQSGLEAGGQLSASEQRDADQSALSAFGNAGINNGNSAIAAQLFSRDAATRARAQQAQQFATGVQGLNTNQAGVAQGAANTFSQTLTNPLLQILGLGNLTPGNTSGGASGASGAVGTANDLFNPINSYSQDLFNTNFNAASSNAIADQNSNSALWSSVIGAAGALLSDDRIKKSVRETDEETPEGIPISTWIFKHDPKKRRYKGVMASDVAKVRPDAVLTDPISGLRAVDYKAIDYPLSIHQTLLQKEAA